MTTFFGKQTCLKAPDGVGLVRTLHNLRIDGPRSHDLPSYFELSAQRKRTGLIACRQRECLAVPWSYSGTPRVLRNPSPCLVYAVRKESNEVKATTSGVRRSTMSEASHQNPHMNK